MITMPAYCASDACAIYDAIFSLKMGICYSKKVKLQPLKSYQWTAETPISRTQLETQRNVFWETQPAYGGANNVWLSLRMACEANNLETAQAIIDSIGLNFPTGKLTDGCYDQLGNLYVIPAMYVKQY